jgi:hypothetical protein
MGLEAGANCTAAELDRFLVVPQQRMRMRSDDVRFVSNN